MTINPSPKQFARYQAAGQSHLWAGYEQLSDAEQLEFEQQLQSFPIEELQRLWQAQAQGSPAAAGESLGERAARAQSPAQLVCAPQTPEEEAAWQAARDAGLEALRAGRVAALVVAGGQGTRLGFEHPKGMFPIGPVTGHSLFQFFCEQILARSREAGAVIPYYVMTSAATHAATVAFFAEHHNFGLPEDSVKFFQQGNMPAMDAATGQLLLQGPGEFALSPDGHGGLLAALQQAGLLQEMRERGIDLLYYHQVDNPLARLAEPEFLGWHLLQNSEVSTKVVRKTGPSEKMGLVCAVDGQTQIIEYSDLPREAAERLTPTGELDLWAGNTAMHVFSRIFLERMASEPGALPWHVARKIVPYWNATEGDVTPAEPNAIKFERFMFDVLPRASVALVVETDRATEFNPVKNAEGVNSPLDVQQSLQAQWTSWANQIAYPIPPHTGLEVNPLFALNAEQFEQRIRAGVEPRHVDGGLLFG